MSPGKAAAQAGHAFIGALFSPLSDVRTGGGQVAPVALVGSNPTASALFREQALAYLSESPGTKVCLRGSLAQIEKARLHAEHLGIPHFLVVDSGCEDFYGGHPIVTALGIGPLYRHQAKPVAGKLRLLN